MIYFPDTWDGHHFIGGEFFIHFQQYQYDDSVNMCSHYHRVVINL